MSLIFDALQRSEGERSGADLSAVSAATELLQRVERQAVSEWETMVHPELADSTESADRDIGSEWPAVPSIVTAVESPLEEELSLNGKRLNQLAQFQSVQVHVPHQNQLVCL